MSSILTNNSAMVALETLRGINKGMSQVQNEISTGKKISTSKDNAAIWAISTVMSSDVESFKQISDSLNLGSATVGIARSASEQVTSLLQDMKNNIVAAQEENVDREKIQTDIGELSKQITAIVDAAQFNGQNLLKGGGSIDILSSLDREANGSVSAANITVNRVDLSGTSGTAGTGALAGGGAATASSATVAGSGASETVTFAAGALTEGDTFAFDLGSASVEYIARDGDDLNDVMRNLKDQMDAKNIDNVDITISNVADPEATDSVLTVTNNGAGVVGLAATANGGGTAGGGLQEINNIDVTTTAGASDALDKIEGLLQTAIDASASFGSKQKRIENQVEFVTTLTDAMKTGIGALTDANMEEASARLQSLQVQQQLGVQALSIANQSPQQLLGLFR